jgi:hypothetical protein
LTRPLRPLPIFLRAVEADGLIVEATLRRAVVPSPAVGDLASIAIALAAFAIFFASLWAIGKIS